VDAGSTVFSVVFGGKPVLSEGAEGGEGWGTLPGVVFTVGGGNDTDRIFVGGKVVDLICKSISKTLVHAATTGEDDVFAKVVSLIFLAGLNGGPDKGVEGLAGFIIKLRHEKEFGALESNGPRNVHNAIVGHGISDVLLGWPGGLGELFLVALINVAELLFHVTNNFHISVGGKDNTITSMTLEELMHPFSEDTTGEIHLQNSVREGETFVDGWTIGNTIANTANETSGSAGGVEGHDSLVSNENVLSLESLEHYFGHPFSLNAGRWPSIEIFFYVI